MEDFSDEDSPLLYAPVPEEHDPAEHFSRLTEGFQANILSAPPNSIISHDSSGYRALDECIDEIGIGRFQLRLLALTSFAYFVEAAEYSLLGLMYPLLAEDFKVNSETELAVIGSLGGMGMIIGATFFAQFSNTFGRRLAYQLSLAICFLFSLVSSFCGSVTAFALARAGLGFGYGGNIVSSTTLLMEFTPTPNRARFMNIAGIFYGIGAIFVVALGWIIVPVIGWRWLLRIVSFCSIPTILLLPFLPESPRFYIMRRRPREAVEVINVVASTNAIPVPRRATIEAFTLRSEPLDVKNQFIRLGESWKTTLPLALVWFTHSFAGAINGFIPLEISKRDSSKTSAKYEISLVLSCGCLVGNLILFFSTVRFGRLFQLRIGLFLTAIMSALLGVESSAIYVYIMTFFYAIISMFPLSMLYLYTGEVHQTETRTIAVAICQFGHRLAPVFSPFVVAALDDVGSFTVTAIVFGAFYFLSFLISLSLKIETFGRPLVEADDLDKEVKKFKVDEEEARIFLKKS